MRESQEKTIEEKKDELNLADVPEGINCEVVKITGGRGCQAKLIGVGIRKGTKIRVISNCYKGPIAVAVGMMRLAIGRGMAYQIRVKLDEKNKDSTGRES